MDAPWDKNHFPLRQCHNPTDKTPKALTDIIFKKFEKGTYGKPLPSLRFLPSHSDNSHNYK